MGRGQKIKKLFWVAAGWMQLVYCVSLQAEKLAFDIRGEAAILINAETGAILFEHQAYHPYYPASTTKVATALYALKQKGDALDTLIEAEPESLVVVNQAAKQKSHYTIPSYWLEPDGTHIGIKRGEVFTLHDLLKGMLIPSGNDAANVIAHALGPTIPVFMEKMNIYLQGIGCQQTKFCNPHGLHDPQHQTTAYDLALITREALKYPAFRAIVTQARFMRPKTHKQAATVLLQTNRLLRPGKFYYSRAIGVKTGYHAKAKRTLIGAAELEGRTLIAVLLGYQERDAIFEDAIKLFEMAFNQPKVQRIYLKAGPQRMQLEIAKANRPLCTYLKEDLSLEYYPAENPQVKCLLYWQTLSLPIAKDQQVGELQLVSADGAILKRSYLYAQEEVLFAWPYRWLPLFLGVGLIATILVGILWKRRHPNSFIE